MKKSRLFLCVWLVISLITYQAASQCPAGFTNSLYGSTRTNLYVPLTGYQFLFPSVGFLSCAAQITRFVILASNNSQTDRGQDTQYPHIQIYRPSQSPDTFTRVSTVGAIDGEVTVFDGTLPTGLPVGDLTLYQYTPDQTLTVYPGDVIGIHVLPNITGSIRTQLIPRFLNNPAFSPPPYVRIPISGSSPDHLEINSDENDVDDGIRAHISVDFVMLTLTPTVRPSSTSSIDTTESTSAPNTTPMPPSGTPIGDTPASSTIGTSALTSDTTPSSSDGTSFPTDAVSTTSSSAMSTFSPSSSPGAAAPPLSVAAISGIVVAFVLIVIIIVLIFVLVLLFSMGKRTRSKTSFSPQSPIQNPSVVEPADNPTYINSNDNRESSGVSSHYDVPGYQDPLVSPIPYYDQSMNGGMTSIYHELQDSNYETETSQEQSNGIYELEPVTYEQPISSKANSVQSYNNSYPDSNNVQLVPAGHDYNTLLDCICVPTDEERQTIARHSQNTVIDEEVYSHIKVIQHQKYENMNFFEQSDIYWTPSAKKSVLYDQLAQRKYREIRRSQLRIIKHLGSGQFGTVNEGVWHAHNGPKGVAIKILTKNSEENKIKLLQEAAIMGQFSHPNVVKLHGVVSMGDPIMIVIELMKNGDLHNHLKSIKPRSNNGDDSAKLPSQLLDYCKQVANGMSYLSKKSFVHRDLAARNIFLDDYYNCKVGDFGMSRDLEDENYYVSQGGKIPVKWTAPEALQYKRYAPPSDVFSYGALLYEIWSLGHKPFEGFSNPQTVDMVQSGYRLPPPPGCPRGVYQMMIHCWHPDSSRRPTFDQILDEISTNSRVILSWRDVDKRVHPQASVLGTPLEAGQDLYPELQQTFVKYTIKH